MSTKPKYRLKAKTIALISKPKRSVFTSVRVLEPLQDRISKIIPAYFIQGQPTERQRKMQLLQSFRNDFFLVIPSKRGISRNEWDGIFHLKGLRGIFIQSRHKLPTNVFTNAQMNQILIAELNPKEMETIQEGDPLMWKQDHSTSPTGILSINPGFHRVHQAMRLKKAHAIQIKLQRLFRPLAFRTQFGRQIIVGVSTAPEFDSDRQPILENASPVYFARIPLIKDDGSIESTARTIVNAQQRRPEDDYFCVASRILPRRPLNTDVILARQVEAILRASGSKKVIPDPGEEGYIKLLFSGLTQLEEIDEAMIVVSKVHQKLSRENINVDPKIRIGLVVENLLLFRHLKTIKDHPMVDFISLDTSFFSGLAPLFNTHPAWFDLVKITTADGISIHDIPILKKEITENQLQGHLQSVLENPHHPLDHPLHIKALAWAGETAFLQCVHGASTRHLPLLLALNINAITLPSSVMDNTRLFVRRLDSLEELRSLFSFCLDCGNSAQVATELSATYDSVQRLLLIDETQQALTQKAQITKMQIDGVKRLVRKHQETLEKCRNVISLSEAIQNQFKVNVPPQITYDMLIYQYLHLALAQILGLSDAATYKVETDRILGKTDETYKWMTTLYCDERHSSRSKVEIKMVNNEPWARMLHIYTRNGTQTEHGLNEFPIQFDQGQIYVEIPANIDSTGATTHGTISKSELQGIVHLSGDAFEKFWLHLTTKFGHQIDKDKSHIDIRSKKIEFLNWMKKNFPDLLQYAKTLKSRLCQADTKRIQLSRTHGRPGVKQVASSYKIGCIDELNRPRTKNTVLFDSSGRSVAVLHREAKANRAAMERLLHTQQFEKLKSLIAENQLDENLLLQIEQFLFAENLFIEIQREKVANRQPGEQIVFMGSNINEYTDRFCQAIENGKPIAFVGNRCFIGGVEVQRLDYDPDYFQNTLMLAAGLIKTAKSSIHRHSINALINRSRDAKNKRPPIIFSTPLDTGVDLKCQALVTPVFRDGKFLTSVKLTFNHPVAKEKTELIKPVFVQDQLEGTFFSMDPRYSFEEDAVITEFETGNNGKTLSFVIDKDIWLNDDRHLFFRFAVGSESQLNFTVNGQNATATGIPDLYISNSACLPIEKDIATLPLFMDSLYTTRQLNKDHSFLTHIKNNAEKRRKAAKFVTLYALSQGEGLKQLLSQLYLNHLIVSHQDADALAEFMSTSPLVKRLATNAPMFPWLNQMIIELKNKMAQPTIEGESSRN